MTSMLSFDQNQSLSKKFTIEIPVKFELAEFLSKSLPDPMICEFLGIDVSGKYTLFNLYTLLKKHLTKRGSAAYYTVSEELREGLSLPDEREMSKAKITHYLMKYIKENGLQSEVWFYFDLDEKLKKLFNRTDKDTSNGNWRQKRDGHCGCNIFDFTESVSFNAHLSDKPIYFDIYGLSEELAEFLGVPINTEMNNVAVLQQILAYIQKNRLQDKDNGITLLPDKKLKDLLNGHAAP